MLEPVRLREILVGAAMALALLGGLAIGVDSCHRKQAEQASQQVQQHVQEADSHAQAAASIPDHKAELAQAQADSDRAWSEVRRLRKIVDARPSSVPNQALPATPSGDAEPDIHTQQLLAADRELIEAQDRQIKALKAALSDEQARSDQWKNAFQHERDARLAQEAATEAWKKAVVSSRWRGRFEGFAAGVALGYAGGKL